MASLHLPPLDLVDYDPSQQPSHRPFSTLDQAALEAVVGLTPSTDNPSFAPDEQLAHLTPSAFIPEIKHDVHHIPDPNHHPLAHQHQQPPPTEHQLHLSNPDIWSLPTTACAPSRALHPASAVPCNLSDNALSPLTHSIAPPPVSPHNPSSSTMSAAAPSSPARGESAVDRAKRAAEEFTQAQLAKKRCSSASEIRDVKRRKSSSCSDEDDPSENLPEKVSHRKYQKRLQKNRDSAFVSRIRRRQYTKVLEDSLLSVEREKDAAVRSFLEMKQRFEIASAELSGIKQAASSNLSQLREGVIARFAGAQQGAEESTQPQQGASRSGTVATMFMFAFMFGALLPDCIKSKSGDGIGVARGRFDFSSSLGSRRPKGAEVQLPSVFNKKTGTFGNVWRISRQDRPEVNQVLLPRQRLLATLRADADRVLNGSAEPFVAGVEAYLNKLKDDEVEGLSTQVYQSCTEGDAGAARVRVLARGIREASCDGNKELQNVLGALDQLSVADEQ